MFRIARRSAQRPPELLPVLSRGKHRSPRKGACFMELASFLAGERWSDHPACTHPLLAAVARSVNDGTSDAGRSRLAALIPSVIGLKPTDPRADARIALRCAITALPVVAADRQRVMAISILSCERLLADLDGRPVGSLSEESRAALAHTPLATAWAVDFARATPTPAAAFRTSAAPNIVRCAVDGIATACVDDPDALLHDLLVGTIAECTALAPAAPAPVATPSWDEVCELTALNRR